MAVSPELHSYLLTVKLAGILVPGQRVAIAAIFYFCAGITGYAFGIGARRCSRIKNMYTKNHLDSFP